MHIPHNGQGMIRTHGAVTPSSFQDLHHQPLGHLTLTILVINFVREVTILDWLLSPHLLAIKLYF